MIAATPSRPAATDAEILGQCLYWSRLATGCESLPTHAQRALAAGAELLELFAPARSLQAVQTEGSE